MLFRSPDGRRKLRQTLEIAAAADVQPTLILTSPLKRAVETAEIAQKVLRYRGQLEQTDALAPNSTVEDVWREIRNRSKESAVLLVGHNPMFADLAGYLLGARNLQIDVKKGSIVRIDFENLSPEPKGILRWFLVARLSACRA